MSDREPVVIAARRSPVGEVGGALKHWEVDRLAAPVLAAVLRDSGLDSVDDVLLGNVLGPAVIRRGWRRCAPGSAWRCRACRWIGSARAG
ncbi:hypothetical protein [Saccharopolyspora gregorii]|uniref:Thiolase N-terminal domain-containing protein n=1 Tax=Saccharopolyspora gregorii TaxID=33914 RepID=A0ABP6RI08_9PSEU